MIIRYTPEELRESVLKNGIRSADQRRCMVCETMIFFRFDGEGKITVEECDCPRLGTPTEFEFTWEIMASWINSYDRSTAARIAKRFGIGE